MKMDKTTYWILRNIQEKIDSKLETREVLQKCAENLNITVHPNVMGKVLKALFPSIKNEKAKPFHNTSNISLDRQPAARSDFWHGIALRNDSSSDMTPLSQAEATNILQSKGYCSVDKSVTDANLMPRFSMFKGQPTFKVSIGVDSMVSVKCNDRQIDLVKHGFPKDFKSNRINLRIIQHFIEASKACRTTYNGCETLVSFHKSAGSELCEPCRLRKNRDSYKKRKYQETDEEEEPLRDRAKSLLTKLSPSLEPSMLELMLSFIVNSQRTPYGRRWDKSIISFALTLWCNSPKAYENMVTSGFCILPSSRTLQMYKNVINHEPGFHNDIFKWMHDTAQQRNLDDLDRHGGIIFDEMSIQNDLQLTHASDKAKLIGAVDMGKDCEAIDSVLKGSTTRQLASHVLQFEFLAYSKITFPFAHFASNSASASHLRALFWEAVHFLQLWDFHVDFVMCDGAAPNRKFLKSMFRDSQAMAENQMAFNNIEDFNSSIIAMADPKHVIKRIRNNILSSSTEDGTRCLIWQSKPIVWTHWQNAYEWDRLQNPEMQRIHHRLTADHINVDSSAKLRNHLAEQVLDNNMLFLMEAYQRSLPTDNQPALDGSIAILRNTSVFVNFFNDDRPIISVNDSRLSQLNAAHSWFVEWEKDVMTKEDMSNKEKKHMLMTWETREDITFMVVGMRSICKKRTQQMRPVMPSRINSDVIENFFCNQRAMNGQNNNPTLLQYQKGINSVLLSTGSRGSAKKSNAGMKAIEPFNLSTPKPC